MRCKALVVSVAFSAALATAGFSFAAGDKPADEKQPAIGTVTAAFGSATIQGATGKRAGDLHSMLNNKERITTDGGGVSILLASRVVLKVDAGTSLTISESIGQTSVILDYGTVHVFVGRRPATAGKVVVQDPEVRTEADGGVYLISYDRNTKSGYYACEHDKLNLAQIGGDEHTVVLASDTQMMMTQGEMSVTNIDRAAFDSRLHSLDRLGQSTVEAQTQEFRLRSRTLDMQQAMSQLSASGWIQNQSTASATPAPAQSASAATAKTDKNGKTVVTVDKPKAASSFPETPAITRIVGELSARCSVNAANRRQRRRQRCGAVGHERQCVGAASHSG